MKPNQIFKERIHLWLIVAVFIIGILQTSLNGMYPLPQYAVIGAGMVKFLTVAI